tara:strand:- start:116 stop:508 length:393 start_codon:yes stop_codon:yes gene_type:complete
LHYPLLSNYIKVSKLVQQGTYLLAVSLPKPTQWKCALSNTSFIRMQRFTGIISYLLGIYLLFVYAFYFNLPPIWAPVLLEITCGTTLFILKVKLDIFENKTYTRTIATQTNSTSNEEEQPLQERYATTKK